MANTMSPELSPSGGGPRAYARAKSLLEDEKLQESIDALGDDRSPAAAALRGAAYYRQEKYGEAAKQLKAALDGHTDGDGQALRALYERALANDVADVQTRVPAATSFDTDGVLPTSPRPGEPREANHPRAAEPTTREFLYKKLGNAAGLKFGNLLGTLTKAFGAERDASSPWTYWYKKPSFVGTVMLAFRRQRLNREQLFSAYPKAAGTAYFKDDGPPPGWVYGARTADGSYNDLEDPMAGAAHVRFGFNTKPTDTKPETGARLMTPNPRTVSRKLFTRKDGFKPIPFFNLHAAAWIQFMNHDWVSYGDPDFKAEPHRIPLMEDDPARRNLHQTHMLVLPTQKDPTARKGEPPAHINEVTSWWDGSQIYGSDAETMKSLRSFQGGKLALDPKTGNIPIGDDKVERTGFRRNWWLGLSLLHNLFVREHNAICDMLAVRYPHFSDQRLFDTARLINAAVMAKIHTVEWTPGVLTNETLNAAMNANWYGFLTNALRPRIARKTLAEINVADPIAGGLVGNTVDNHGVPYSLTREFLSVYRLHSLLPDQVSLYCVGKDQPEKTWALAQLRQAASHLITNEVPLLDLNYSFGIQHAGQLVLNNYPETLQNLSVPGAGFYDLGAVDILRDRERGVPRYNQFRRLMGMRPLARIEQLSDDAEAIKALKSVYDDIEDVDLLVGNLAESQRPTGFGFGETLFEVFILNASRRLQADRFFTDSYREDVYTMEGLEWIDDVTLRKVFLRHFPELSATGLSNVDNAFEPWDRGLLKPERHPLRAFDSELRAADEKAKLFT